MSESSTQPSGRERKKRKWDQPSQSAQQLNLMALQGMGAAGIFPFQSGISFMQGLSPSVPEPGLKGSTLPASSPVVNTALVQQNAAAIVQKINQDLVARGVLKDKAVEETVSKEIVINDTEPGIRTKLIKRQTQEEIQAKTGAVLVTRGRYRPPGAVPEHAGDKPLYLHIFSGIHLKSKDHADRVRAVDEAVAIVESMMGKKPQQSQQSGTALLAPTGYGSAGGMVFDNSHTAGGIHATTVYIADHGLPPDSEATGSLQAKIRGPNNEYLDHIQRATGATITVRGRGSGNFEGARGEELPDRLHLLIRCATMEGLNHAKGLAENLVETVKQELLYSKGLSVDDRTGGFQQHGGGQGSEQCRTTPPPSSAQEPPPHYLPPSAGGPYVPQPPRAPPPPFPHSTPPPYTGSTSTGQPSFHQPPQPLSAGYPPLRPSHPPYSPYPPAPQSYQPGSQGPYSSNVRPPYTTVPPPPSLSSPSSGEQEGGESQQPDREANSSDMGGVPSMHTGMGAPSLHYTQHASQPQQPGSLSYPMPPPTTPPEPRPPTQPPSSSEQPQQTALQYSTYAAPPAWTPSPPPPHSYGAMLAPSYSGPNQLASSLQSSYSGYSSVPPPVYGGSTSLASGSAPAMSPGSYSDFGTPSATAYPYQAYGVYQSVAAAGVGKTAGGGGGVQQGITTGNGQSQRSSAQGKAVQPQQRRRFQEFVESEPARTNQNVQQQASLKSSSYTDAATRAMPPPPPKAMPSPPLNSMPPPTPRAMSSNAMASTTASSQPPQAGIPVLQNKGERPAVVSSTTSKLVDYGEEDDDDGGVTERSHEAPSTAMKPFWAT